jgi:hypothetical protein
MVVDVDGPHHQQSLLLPGETLVVVREGVVLGLNQVCMRIHSLASS